MSGSRRYVHWMIDVKHPASEAFTLHALELDEDLPPVAVAEGFPGSDVPGLDGLLPGALTVGTQLACVPKLRSGTIALVTDSHQSKLKANPNPSNSLLSSHLHNVLSADGVPCH